MKNKRFDVASVLTGTDVIVGLQEVDDPTKTCSILVRQTPENEEWIDELGNLQYGKQISAEINGLQVEFDFGEEVGLWPTRFFYVAKDLPEGMFNDRDAKDIAFLEEMDKTLLKKDLGHLAQMISDWRCQIMEDSDKGNPITRINQNLSLVLPGVMSHGIHGRQGDYVTAEFMYHEKRQTVMLKEEYLDTENVITVSIESEGLLESFEDEFEENWPAISAAIKAELKLQDQ